jgi:hypothetical protein
MYKKATGGYRYSLRMLLVAVLFFRLRPCSILARMQKARRQRQSAQVFRQMGAEVRHKLLFERNGDVRRISTIIYVSLGGTNALDTDLACLKDLEDLEHLSLWNTRITDAGVC